MPPGPVSTLFHTLVIVGASMGCAKHHVVESVDAGRDGGRDGGRDAGPPDTGPPDAGVDADAGCAPDCEPCFDDRMECLGCTFMGCIL